LAIADRLKFGHRIELSLSGRRRPQVNPCTFLEEADILLNAAGGVEEDER